MTLGERSCWSLRNRGIWYVHRLQSKYGSSANPLVYTDRLMLRGSRIKQTGGVPFKLSVVTTFVQSH